LEVVGVAADAPDLIRKTNAHKPDVVVTRDADGRYG
jgi:hypothetical protein